MVADFEDYAELHGGVTADKIKSAADDPTAHTATVQSLIGDLADDDAAVASNIEGDVTDATQMNLEPATNAARRLAQNGTYAIGLLTSFAATVSTFDSTVTTLNEELNANTTARFNAQPSPSEDEGSGDGADTPDPLTYPEIKAQEKAKLQGRYDRALETLETEADSVAGKFESGPTEADVRSLVLAGLIPLTQASLWPGLALNADDKFQYYKNRVNAGLMTEEERLAFREANPDLLEQWMEVPHPSEDLQAAIISLALPRVDADDGEADADRVVRALDDANSSGPAGFLSAMENVQDVNNGLALLAPWAAKNGIDLARNASVTGAQDYLQKFVADTWDKQSDIQDYIKDDKHRWTTSYTVSDGTHFEYHEGDGYSDGQQSNMFKAYANAILNTSQEDFGGGYTDLPEDLRHDAEQVFSSEMKGSISGAYWTFDDAGDFQDLAELMVHGDAAPGDDLAKQMASSAATSTANSEDFWANQPGGDRQDPWNTGLLADVLDMTSRNRDATADLVAGEDVPPNYRSDFNATILDQPFDLENGDEAKAAQMYSWIHDDAVSDDPAAVERADRAFDKLSQDITSTEDGNFRHLMGGEGESAAYRNTLITREIADAFSDHLDEFASESGTDGASGSPLSEGDRIRLMTYIASDHVGDADTGQPSSFDYDRGAGRLSAYVAAYQQDAIREWSEHPTTENTLVLGDKNGRLQGLWDAALINEAQERGLNADDQEAERVRNMKIASGIAATLAGKIPGAGDILGPAAGVGNTLLSNLLTAEHMPEPNAEQLPDWQADGANVTTNNTLAMVDALVDSGRIDRADLPASLANPEGTSNANVQGAAIDFFSDYFSQNPPHQDSVYTNFTTELHSTYKGYNDQYKLDQADKLNKDDFLDQDDWGRP